VKIGPADPEIFCLKGLFLTTKHIAHIKLRGVTGSNLTKFCTQCSHLLNGLLKKIKKIRNLRKQNI